MENFVSEIKTQNPSVQIDPVTREEDMAWIAYKSKEQNYLEHSRVWPLSISTDRFINALFTDASHLTKLNREKLLTELHTIASDMQDVEIKVSLYDLFTEEEMQAVYQLNNSRMTLHNGDEIMNGGIAARCAISLWDRIEADADAAIARGGVGADLRFGHERVADGQDRGQQKHQGKDGTKDEHAHPAKAALLFPHPSTSFPNQSSALNKRAIKITITMAMITAAADSFW
jgi:hypothetical protein